MKRSYVLFTLLLVGLVSFGCAKEVDLEQVATDMNDYIGQYIDDKLKTNELMTVDHVDGDLEDVVAYVGKNEYGLIIFNYNVQTKDINFLDVSSKIDESLPAYSLRSSGDEQSYVSVFIRDKDIWLETSSIEVSLMDSSKKEPEVLVEKTYGNQALIFTYGDADDIREVAQIKLYDKDGNILYNSLDS